jgi:hypothetical protein
MQGLGCPPTRGLGIARFSTILRIRGNYSEISDKV